jgi:menaquinone-dependent protoporphyrinogen oxidase
MADRILVTYGSKYGATAQIADAIGRTLGAKGLAVDVRRAADVRSLDGYRGLVLGSAVYMGRWRPDAVRLLRRCRRLGAPPDVWLFSSGPVGEQPAGREPGGDRWTRPKRVERLAADIGAHDHAVFGGCIAEDGGILRRNMAKSTPPELRDLRDWDAIGAWAEQIGNVLVAPR